MAHAGRATPVELPAPIQLTPSSTQGPSPVMSPPAPADAGAASSDSAATPVRRSFVRSQSSKGGMGSLAEAVALIAAAKRLSTPSEETSSVSDGLGSATCSRSSSSLTSVSYARSPQAEPPPPERVLELEGRLAASERRVFDVTAELRRTQDELQKLTRRHERQTLMMQVELQIVRPRKARAIRRTHGLL